MRSDAARDSRNGRNRISSCSARRQIFFQPHPVEWGQPFKVPAVIFKVRTRRGGGAVYFGSSRFLLSSSSCCSFITILNRCHRFPGFVYRGARFSSDGKQHRDRGKVPASAPKAVCHRVVISPHPDIRPASCRTAFPSLSLLGISGFSSLRHETRRLPAPLSGGRRRRRVPWGDGKRTLTRAYMLVSGPMGPPAFMERNGRGVSALHGDKVFDAVEHVVTYGLEHRKFGRIDAIRGR